MKLAGLNHRSVLFERSTFMTIEIVLEGKLEEEKDFEGYLGLIQEICQDKKIKM